MIETTAPSPAATPVIVLASTSRYRRELLSRLLEDRFQVCAPDVDETPQPNETPADAARRLSLAKARAVAARFPDAYVIGSDQTATVDDRNIVGKPGTHERAVAQLRAASGRSMRFHTGVALVSLACGFEELRLVTTTVRFRTLTDRQIESYLVRERPYDCAGSARSEALGIALLEALETPDPTALVGLPLIAVCEMLERAGAPVLPP